MINNETIKNINNTKGEMEMNNELNNGVQVNNIEGMDINMNKLTGVKTALVGNVVKATGLTAEEVIEAAVKLELTVEGRKIVNVVDTVTVVEAIKEFIANAEVAVTINANNNEEVEGMDVEMKNNIKEELMKEVYSQMNKELAKEAIRQEYLNRVATVVEKANKKYKRNSLSTVEFMDYVEANKIMATDEELKALYKNLSIAKDKESKRELLVKIINQLNDGIFTYKMYATANKYKHLLNEDELDTLKVSFQSAIAKSTMKNYKNILAVKRWSKDIPVVLLRRVVSFGNGFFINEIAPQMTSALVNSCKIVEKEIADNKMTLEGKTTDELLLFSFDSDSLQFNSSNERENIAKKDDLATVFEMISGLAKQKAFIVERVSGLADFYTDRSKIKLMPGEVIKQYEFLGITPSGLRSGTMTLAITKEIHADGTEVNRDRRIEMLDQSSDNAFSKNFIEGYDENGMPIFKACDSLLDAFKDMSRMMLSATSSKALGTIDSYLVVNNLAHNAGYSANDYRTPTKAGDTGFVNCEDTTDGLGLLDAAFSQERLHEANVPCSIKDLLGMTFQARGGGLKIAAMLRSKNDLRIEAQSILARGGKILKAIYKGKELTTEELMAKPELLNEFVSNLQGIFDKNGMKLIEHDEAIEIVMLKKAYSSDSRLSDVLNIIMMVTDEKATTALLSKRIKASIIDKIRDIGISMDYNEETGEVSNIKCDPAKMRILNNDSQVPNWIFKSFPETMIAVAPGVQKTDFNSLLKGVANLINELNVEVDCEYTVVQSDAAVRFGVRILNEDEVYCPSFADVKKVSGVRHPVSNLFAVSTFKTVTIQEIAKRINALKVTDEVKEMLFNFYKGVEGYAIIPASHYYMEKHDGMDFDIDAMQFFKDADVIAILENVSDIGTIIDRTIDEEMNCSIENSADDNALQAFYKDIKKKEFKAIPYGMEVVSAAPRKSIKGVVRPTKKTVAKNTITYYKKNADGKYPLDFSSVSMMVLDYFLNPIDSVGIMATNFYNNAKILMALRSANEEITKEMKAFIVNGMRKMFSCVGIKSYKTPIRVAADGSSLNYAERNKIVIYKDKCHQVIKSFVNSKGDYSDCVQFLIDVCICSRYPAETSIDSAKKMYKVINMFALSGCIKAMGAKNAVKFLNFDPFKTDEDGNLIEAEESIAEFNKYIDIFNIPVEGEEASDNYTYDNFFDLKLIKEEMKCVGWKGVDAAKNAFFAENKVAGVKDPIYLLKEELMNFANSITVIAAKELEAFVKSDRAAEIRKEMKAAYTKEKDYFRVDKVVSNIVGTYITLTESITNSNQDEIDEVTAKKYLMKNAMQALRNTANLSFKAAKKPLTDEEIGAGVIYYMITSFEKSTKVCTTVHSEIFTIFQNEILAFLKSRGMEVLAAEEIQYAVNSITNRQFKLADLEGLTCSAYKGHGEVELLDEDATCLLVLKNKKATFENGTIQFVDGKYVVIQERKALEESAKTGFYFGAKIDKGVFGTAKLLMDPAKKSCDSAIELQNELSKINPTNILAEKDFDEIIFTTRQLRDENNKSYRANLIVGMKDDQEFVIAELYVNTVVAQLLNDTPLSLSNLRLFMTDKNCTVNIVDENLLAEVQQATVTKTDDINAFMDGGLEGLNETTSMEEVEFNSEIPMPEAEDLAALGLHTEEEDQSFSDESMFAFSDSDIPEVDLFAGDNGLFQ